MAHSYQLLEVERRAAGLERVNLQTRKVGYRVPPTHPQVILFRDKYQPRCLHFQHLKGAFTIQGQGGSTSNQSTLLNADASIYMNIYMQVFIKSVQCIKYIKYNVDPAQRCIALWIILMTYIQTEGLFKGKCWRIHILNLRKRCKYLRQYSSIFNNRVATCCHLFGAVHKPYVLRSIQGTKCTYWNHFCVACFSSLLAPLSHMSPFCQPAAAAWLVSSATDAAVAPLKRRLQRTQRHLHFCISLW